MQKKAFLRCTECGRDLFQMGGPSAAECQAVEYLGGKRWVDTSRQGRHWRDALAAAATWPGSCASATLGGSPLPEVTACSPAARPRLTGCWVVAWGAGSVRV